MSDIDPDGITRPDILAAIVVDDDARSSGFHQRVERELVPYSAVPVLTSRLNEPTVPDAALRISMARARAVEEHTPSEASVPPLSGTRNQLSSSVPPPVLASTVPPPERVRTKRPTTPTPTRAAEAPRREEATPSKPASAPSAAPSAVPPAPRESHLRAYLLIVATAVGAAALGAGLGNGSLIRFGERLQAAFVDGDTPPPLVASRSAAPRALSAAPAQAVPPALPATGGASVEDAAKVPFLRLDQLPPTEPDAGPAEAEPSEAKRVEAKPAEAKRAHKASRR